MLIREIEWASIRQRAQLPAFEAVMSRLRGEVEAFISLPLAIPTEPAGYYHDYFCPEHGIQLAFDATSPSEHLCPKDGAVFRGSRYDAAWRWFVNNQLSEAALRLALLWRLEGDLVHHTWAVKILKEYADRYPKYRAVDRISPNPGVATFSSLDEAAWILPLAWALDMVRNSLSKKEQDDCDSLLISAAEHLVEHHFSAIHNVACWHNAAVGTIGLVLGRQNLVDFAIHSKFGFDAQLREGVLDDGLWFEGSFSYHFYSLAALLALAKATRHTPGLDLPGRPALRAMLLAPIQCAYPDGSLPATNDCWYFTSLAGECCHGVPPAAAFYELGYAWYGDPHFAQVLDRAYCHGTRDSLDALLFGQESIPTADVGPLSSVHLPASGYAILRSGPPTLPKERGSAESSLDVQEQRYALLKYGPHGGVHGHPDKLNLVLFGHGRRLSPDLGTPGYGIGLWENWYRQTISHNTVTIDGLSQPPAEGQMRIFNDGPTYQAADANVEWAVDPYAGIRMRRAILARPDYFLDVFLVTCDRPRRIDWAYRNAGTCDPTFALNTDDSVEMDGDGYENISKVRWATTDDDFAATWHLNGVGVQLYAAGAPSTELILGSAPGNPPTDRHTLIINRRRSTSAAFLSVFHPFGRKPLVTSVRWTGRDLLGTGWAGCVVQLGDAVEHWSISLSPDTAATPLSDHDDATVVFEYCLGYPDGELARTLHC